MDHRTLVLRRAARQQPPYTQVVHVRTGALHKGPKHERFRAFFRDKGSKQKNLEKP